MGTNNIQPFATGAGANVLTDTAYLADSQLPIGNQAGRARSDFVNKTLRQCSVMAATLGQYIADLQANNVTDSVSVTNLTTYLKNSLATSATQAVNVFGIGLNAITTASSDLNSITVSGFYRANASTLNSPVATRFYTVMHLVTDVSTNATQVAIDVNNTGELFIRQRTTAGGWGLWRAIATRAFALGDDFRGQPPRYASTTTINAQAMTCADTTRTVLLTPATTTINAATTGLNGLDTGTLTQGTWYYLHAINNPTTGVHGWLLSASSSSPAMPSGFTNRRLTPYVFRTYSNSATFQQFRFVKSGQTVRCNWMESTRPDAVVFNQTVLDATPYVLDFATTVPPICNGTNAFGIASLRFTNADVSFYCRLEIDPSTSGLWTILVEQGWREERVYEFPLYVNDTKCRIMSTYTPDPDPGVRVTTFGYVFNYEGVV